MESLGKAALLPAVMMLILTLQAVHVIACMEIDMISTAVSVHDGDTFTLATGDRVRLADLNAPELGEEGSYEARDYLSSLILHKTVYLDVDDKYRKDTYGRLVCVVYVDYNSTHYLNVNKALIEGGYAEARDYNNEFNFNTFVLYCPKAETNGSDPILTHPALAAVAAIVLGLVLLVLSRMRR
ncbi:MAG: thermonuclease family protein [Candidatus Methanosuratincola sp.]